MATKKTEKNKPENPEDVKTVEEIRSDYKKMNEEFKEEVSKINSVEELEKKEEDLMKLMDMHDKYIRGVEYDLPNEVKFEDETYSRNWIFARIKTLLERHEVEFTYVYGLYHLAKFWASIPAKVSYGALDSTLRLLEQLKYSGKDWHTILAINAFFQKSNEEYNKDMAKTMFLAERHNIIIERMDLLKPVGEAKGGESAEE